jgi:MoaA/NifB/PqqE/SkfB family radical SAM enzyme
VSRAATAKYQTGLRKIMIQIAPDITVHLDAPLGIPRQLTQTAISGWIISQTPIRRVSIPSECQDLALIERPDVKSVYPNYPYVTGYVGIVPTAAVARDKKLDLAYELEGARHNYRFELNGKGSFANRVARILTGGKQETASAEWSEDIALRLLRQINEQLHEVDKACQNVEMLSTPMEMFLEMTNRCNLKCRTCARNYWDKSMNPFGDMQMELVERLIPYIERAQHVNFLGYGETVLSPSFRPIVDRLVPLKPELMMFSNGTTLKPNIVDFILERGFKSVFFSIDGATDASVQHARTAPLSAIMKNVAYLIDRGKQRGLPCPELSLSFTASRKNIGELRPLVELAGQRGFKRIHVGLFKIFTPALQEESLFLTPEPARQAFLAAQELGARHGVEVILPPEFGASLACNQPFRFLMVKWDGNIRPCCSTAIVASPPLYIETGNLYETPLPSLWNCEKAKQVRLGLLGKGEMHPVCAHCPCTRFDLEHYTRFLDA